LNFRYKTDCRFHGSHVKKIENAYQQLDKINKRRMKLNFSKYINYIDVFLFTYQLISTFFISNFFGRVCMRIYIYNKKQGQ